MKKIIIIILLCFVTNIQASTLLDFSHYNSRLYGSGESMLVEKKDINNIDIFPASISQIDGQILSIGYMKWDDTFNIIRIGYAHNLGNKNVIGGTINYCSLKEVENYDEYGNFLGNLKNNDILVNIGYGGTLKNAIIKNDINIGINVKYLNMNIGEYKANWIGAGISVMTSLHVKGINIKEKNNLNLGIGIQDINLIKAKFDIKSSDYPVSFYGGLIYKFLKISEIKIKTGTTYTYIAKYSKHYISTGLEFNYRDLLYLRNGYYILGRDSDKMAIGLGVGQAGIKFDYSITFLEDGTGHFAQLSFIFTSM